MAAPRADRWAWARRWYVAVGAAWLIRFVTMEHIPFVQTAIWREWFDQSRYFASALALAHGDLSPTSHWYPLAYPLVAAPFAWIIAGDPFVLPDLALYLLTAAAFRRVAARLGIGGRAAALCFVATTLIHGDQAGAWVHPWTTTLSAALIWWLAERTLSAMAGEGEDDGRLAFAIGALAAAIPLVRPADVPIGLTCGLVTVAAIAMQRRRPWRRLVALAAGGFAVLLPYAMLHLAIYGPHATPYMTAAAATGFIWSDLGWKAYVLLVSARPWFPDTDAILQVMPWIVPGAAGLAAATLAGPARERRVAVLLIALIVPAGAVMLTYADLQPPGLWRFGNMHYFKWMMPAFGAGLILVWQALWIPAGRRRVGAALAVLMLPLAIRIVPQRVDERSPARMLQFHGATDRVWDEAFFAPVVIVDARGRMENVRNFHQVPDPAGERAIAISRLFAADPRRDDPGERPPLPHQPPYARYGERITLFGL